MGPRQIRWLAIAAVLLVLAGAIAWLAAPRPTPAELAAARLGPIAESVSDQGEARVREAYVVAAPVSGRLRRIELEVGDRVVAGQTVVARIDPAAADLLDVRGRAQAEAAVAAARAAVAAAGAQRERLAAEARRAEASLARVRTLAAKGIASPQALDDAQAAVRVAQAAVRAAEAERAARQADLGRARAVLLGPEAAGQGSTPVTSPATGYVTRVLQESARTVPVGAPLVEIGDSSGLEASIEFLSQDAVRIREGMEAEIFDWGGPGALPARVRRVEPQGFTKTSALGVEEQRVRVFLQFAGPPARWVSLGPGYRVWGRVILRRAPAVLKVPLGALARAGEGWAVFRLEDGRARLVPVSVGAMTDAEAEIRSGLAAGDRVVVFPSDKVRDGVRLAARP
ncbi:HlyD family secretion protein [Caulobacter ginsengisoli]|uniref:HlyD family secretion protein n=1 Tax=Caulobacter ginsengisoli TaxID=400775 RepID=A0ABU0IY86_9CAUL|nr:efflux RND transporter periplasmic adaptor subunit [Caulobacter ginsengisoli]MDQ0466973.1 HlyD family secretion protein [Caulobacter ginsengisoli]